jgi:hypothetical protein
MYSAPEEAGRQIMRHDYALHTLGEGEFEDFVCKICLHWLGPGVIPFCTGPDGGRDARFHGTATHFPSSKSPLKGKTVIQAKHCGSADASCSDASFKTKFRKEEIPRVRGLVKDGVLDHYLLFTNRKLSGKADKDYEKRVLGVGAKTATVIARERLHLELDTRKELLAAVPAIGANLTPLRFMSTDLASIIPQVAKALASTKASVSDSAHNFTFVKKNSRKNRLNRLTRAYYEFIEKESLPYFQTVKKFLENRRNESYADLYHDTADELKQKITVYRNHFDTFDEILLCIRDEVISSNPDLKSNRRLVNLLLHYMYFDCDIGRHA